MKMSAFLSLIDSPTSQKLAKSWPVLCRCQLRKLVRGCGEIQFHR
jgi:hypothetical protein